MSDKNSDIAEVIKQLIYIEPFYGYLSLGVSKYFSDAIPTACVGLIPNTIDIRMLVNSEFWQNLSDDHKVGLLMHEMLHIAFFHLFNFDDLNDKRLRNIAMDMMLNQYIPSHLLPPQAIMPETFPNIKLEPFKSTRYYYQMLQESNDPRLQSLLDHMGEGKPSPCDHPLWDEEAPQGAKELAKSQIEHSMKTVYEENLNSDPGKLPGHMKDIIKGLYKIDPPVTDWKRVVRRFGSKSDKVFIRPSRSKLNRRFGSKLPGFKKEQHKKLIVAIDTSGSVSGKDLEDFFGQIYHIWKGGTKVTVVECDTQINRVYEYKGELKDIKVSGRGGTCFEPPIEMLNKDPEQNGLIYFTDGEAYCSIKPMKPVLWIISKNRRCPDLPGAVLQMN